jgi:hypothetical protein
LGSRSPQSLRSGDADGHRARRRIAFGALEAVLEVEYARYSIGFGWAGCDEGDQVEGEGTAELLDDGTIEIEFAYDNSDEAVLKAKRDLLQQPVRGAGGTAIAAMWCGENTSNPAIGAPGAKFKQTGAPAKPARSRG